MAITENIFTAEELRNAVKASPDLRNIISGYALEDTDIRSKLEPEFINPKTKEWAERIETDVLETTGIKKNDGEKYYDYLKRAFKEKTDGITAELETLKSKRNPSEADKQQIKSLEDALKKANEDGAKAIQDKDAEILKLKASTHIDLAIEKLRGKYLQNIPESLIKVAEEKARETMLKEAKIQDDGALTFFDGEKLRQNSEYKPLSSEDYAATLLKDVVDAGKKQPGTGSGNPNPNDPPKKPETGKFAGVPAEVKTKVQLTEHLLGLGIMQGTEDFDTIFAEHGASLPLR